MSESDETSTFDVFFNWDDVWTFPQFSQKTNTRKLESYKDSRQEIIEICLVETLSASMACHLVINRMPDLGFLPCHLSSHDA